VTPRTALFLMAPPILALAAVLFLPAAPAAAEHRYEVPELGPHYDQPETTKPGPRRQAWREWVDVGLLVVWLAAGAAMALVVRSRVGVLVLAVGALVWFGFVRKGCVCPIGAIGNAAAGLLGDEMILRPDEEALAAAGVGADRVQAVLQREYTGLVGAEYHEGPAGGFHVRFHETDENEARLDRLLATTVARGEEGGGATLRSLTRLTPAAVVPIWVIAFLTLPLAATLLFGRAFCGAVCPLGAIQDVVVLKPVRVPEWLGHGLGVLPWAFLGLAVLLAATGGGYVICRYDPFVPIFRLSGAGLMFLLGGCFLLIGLFVGRPYCRYACPLGAIFGVLGRLSWKRVTITPDECIRCRLCEDVCPFGAIRPPSEHRPADARLAGKGVLVATLVLAPVLIAVLAVAGYAVRGPLAQMNPTVRLAGVVRDAETDAELRTDAGQSRADMLRSFESSGRPAEELFEEEAIIRGRVAAGSAILGAFLGLVIALKLIDLSTRRTRTDYEADRSRCFACGRCFKYCPREQLRRGKVGLRRETEEKRIAPETQSH
jgi:ferredoxin